MSNPKVIVPVTFGNFHEKWIYYLQQFGVDVSRVDLLRESFSKQIESCDGVMWHLSMKPSILQSVEPILSPVEFILEKPVFPNYKTRWHFENKVAQKYLFETLRVSTPETRIFWDKNTALEWLENEAVFPLVHKGARGAGSRHVTLVKNVKEAVRIVNENFAPRGAWNHKGYRDTAGRKGSRLLLTGLANIGTNVFDAIMLVLLSRRPHLPSGYWMPEKDVVLFQEFLPENDYDTRITIIGDRAFGFRRMNREGDFRASGGGALDYDQTEIDMNMIRIAFEVSRSGGFQSMAYDFLRDMDGKSRICEMSFGYQNTAIHNCQGHWDLKLEYHHGHMWPEEAIVKDFLDEL